MIDMNPLEPAVERRPLEGLDQRERCRLIRRDVHDRARADLADRGCRGRELVTNARAEAFAPIRIGRPVGRGRHEARSVRQTQDPLRQDVELYLGTTARDRAGFAAEPGARFAERAPIEVVAFPTHALRAVE